MGRRFHGLGAAFLVAGLIAGCGSSSSSTSSTSTPTTRGATTAAATTTAATTTAGTAPSTATLATLHRITAHRRLQPRFKGLQGLDLSQKIQALAANAGAFWTSEFAASQAQLPPATVNVVAQTPLSCGAGQITTTDPPEYCSSDGSIDFPLAFMQSSVAPIGDAAVALVVSDLYGYHIENALGALGAGYSPATLQKLDSCLSGVYFYSIQGNLTTGDQAAVNTILAEKATPPGGAAGGAAVSATDLTSAFNKGILSQGRAQVCLPPKS
jgi:hypothetical protein